MPSEVEKIRTVPKYRIVAKAMEACPMFAMAQVYVYEIVGSAGRYHHKFDLKTSLKELKALDCDLERFVVALPDHVTDTSSQIGETND